MVILGVDPVADHVHLAGDDAGVAGKHVTAHGLADRDDRVRGFACSPLGPGGQPGAAAELLGFPRAPGLQ
jgi:hypothetical protein